MKENTELIYPKHKHPHGIENSLPDNYRIWICDECGHIFTDEEIRADSGIGWGHACKSHPCRKGQRCESHLESYIPEPLIEQARQEGRMERLKEVAPLLTHRDNCLIDPRNWNEALRIDRTVKRECSCERTYLLQELEKGDK